MNTKRLRRHKIDGALSLARTIGEKAESSRSKGKAKKTEGAQKKTAVKKKTATKSKTANKRRIVRIARARRSAATAAILETLTGPERVARAKALLAQGSVYAQGCSGYVCDVLQISWRSAKEIMAGSNTPANSIGKQPNYSNVRPGDVCGWLKTDDANPPQDDHVTIWIGEPGMRFIDVQRPGGLPRKLGNGYELNQTLWKSQNI